MKTLIRLFATISTAAIVSALTPACVKPGAGTGTDEPTPGNSLLYLKVSTKNDGDKVVSRQACSVPIGSAVGATINCTATIPQEQLYKSALLLSQSTDSAGNCDTLEFVPYVYQASRTANYKPEWADAAVNCSSNPPAKECYNGPAPQLITNFPSVRSKVQSTAQGTTFLHEIPSAESLKRHSNRFAANDLVADRRTKDLAGSLASVPVADDFLSGTMSDYKFMCKDSYGATLYSIILTVTSQVSASPSVADVSDSTVNRRASWVGTLAPQPLSGTTTGTFPFQVTVQTLYEKADTSQLLTHKICATPPTMTAGSTAAVTQTCTVNIPEAQLHFGSLIITETTDPATGCELLTAQPYWYVASRSAGFFPSWVTSAIDCSTTPLSNDCYGGIAPFVVPDWPQFTYLYQTVVSSSSITITAPSANERHRSSNRFTANTLSTAKRLTDRTGAGDGYVNRSMVDYSFACRDKNFQPLYMMTLTIDDINIDAGDNPDDEDKNHFGTWNSGNARIDPQ